MAKITPHLWYTAKPERLRDSLRISSPTLASIASLPCSMRAQAALLDR